MKKYTHSGKFRLLPVILWTLVGLVAGAALSVAYTFIAHFDPLIYLNFLVMMGMMFAMTGLVVFIIRRSHSRNQAVNLAVTFLVCLFSWYVGWCVILGYVLEKDFLKFLIHPAVAFDAMNYYCDRAMQWTLNDTVISPPFLKLIYAFEFLAYFFPMWLVAKTKMYYCEFCEGFMKEKNHFITEATVVDEHLPAVREGDLSLLDRVTLLDKADTSDTAPTEQYRLNLHRCAGCGERVFNLYHLRMRRKKGKSEVAKTTTVVEDLYAARPTQQ